jgi:hypothetical protein
MHARVQARNIAGRSQEGVFPPACDLARQLGRGESAWDAPLAPLDASRDARARAALDA